MMNGGLAGIGGMLGGICTLAGGAIGFVYFLGPCLGGASTKVIPMDAEWSRPTGASQTICAATSGAVSDIFANLFKQNVQGRVAGTIPITGRGVGLPESQRRTRNDVSGGYTGPYNTSLSPDEQWKLNQWRLENPNAPADAHPNNVDGGFDWPFMPTSTQGNRNYTYGSVLGEQVPTSQQPTTGMDQNGDGVIDLSELQP